MVPTVNEVDIDNVLVNENPPVNNEEVEGEIEDVVEVEKKEGV